MKFLLYPHGGSGNHGCEAIVRSTKTILGGEFSLMTSCQEEDIRYGLGKIVNCIPDRVQLSHRNPKFYLAFFQRQFFNKDNALDLLHFSPVFEAAKTCDVALSIGGDNYCYGKPNYIYLINEQLSKMHVPIVLWGCSIEPDAIDNQMLLDLHRYSHIYARESLTYRALIQRGLQNVSLVPDPAFLLEKSDVALPKGFVKGNTLGINVSPMIIKHETIKGIVLNNYYRLIDYVLNNTDMQIALIPHVVWGSSDDRKSLNEIYNHYKGNSRIVYIADNNAVSLKSIISNCRYMITARTHASIAAYSTMVPTIVLGYSIKARGIAIDLFGTDKHYVISVKSIMSETQLLDDFLWLTDNESIIRNHLVSMIPVYLQAIRSIKSII
ncbi:MAG: polysaccharide pyruvyl transferase family protein [Bacteroidales bacterium]|nr:polysaccharide pyruvyl transferase family protein [Bacteroidales bacterium]